LLFLVAALSAWMLSTPATGPSRRWRLPAIRIDDRLILAALVATVLVLGFLYSTRVAGGADSYGYVSQAELWRRGRLTTMMPWIRQVPWPNPDATFSPLGYRPSTDGQGIVPSYPPGLPILMAGASLVAGYCAKFWVVPVSAATIMLATFFLGRRLSGSRVGLTAALLTASSPVFLFMLPNPMSDVPVTAAWILALLWVYSRSAVSATASGLASGLGAMIRPNLAPLAMVPLGWLVYKMTRAADAAERRQRRRQVVAYLAGIAPGAVVLALFNWQMYGSPLRSGYGEVTSMFAWSNVWPNVKNYVLWFAQTQTVLPFAGAAALLLPRFAGWPATTDRSYVVALGLFVALLFAQYCAYGVFDAWWYLRFLLPGFPLVMLGFAQIVLRIAVLSTHTRVLATIIVLVLVGRGAQLGVKQSAFKFWQGEYRYVATAHLVRDLTEPNSVILAGQHSGAIRYYAGRVTLTFFGLDPKWLDRTVDFLEDHGAHPYALLEDWEVTDFRNYFPEAKKLALLDSPPMLEYKTAGTTRLFDLSRRPRMGTTSKVREQPQPGPVCYLPAPTPQLVLK
jgi:hypothetical protein